KKGKGIGKKVVQLTFTFSTAMNPGTIANAGAYQVAWVSTKKVKKRVQTVPHPVAVLSATADPSNTVVTVVTSAPKTKFKRGGEASFASPGATLRAAGASLGGSTVFVIGARAGSLG